jgi:hypothetical protein
LGMESPFIIALAGLMTPTVQACAAVESVLRQSRPAAKRVFCCLCQDPVGIVKENSMEHAYCIAPVWLALAVVSTILANHLRVSMALLEICVGITALTNRYGNLY